MLAYLHHIIFDPLSAWEQFKVAMVFILPIWLIFITAAAFVSVQRKP